MTLLSDLQADLAAILSVPVLLNPPEARTTPEAFDPSTQRLVPLVYLSLSAWPQRGPYLAASVAMINVRCYSTIGRDAEALATQIRQRWNIGEAVQDLISSILDLRWVEDPGPLPSRDPTWDPPEIYWPSRYQATLMRESGDS